MLVTAALFGDAAVRDVEAGMDPLLFTAPLGKVEYLGGRFVAALTVNAVVMVAVPVGLVTASGLIGWFEPETVGPFRVGAYVQPYLLFLLPNLILTGAILYTIGVLARKVIPVFLGAIGLFISYLVAMSSIGQIEHPLMSVLIDPLGFRSLEATTQYWTAAERNTQLIGFPVGLLWNRIVWLALAAVVLAVLYWRFRFAHPDVSGGRGKAKRAIGEAMPERRGAAMVPHVAGSFGFRLTVRQTLAVAGNALTEVVASRWFVLALLGCTGVTLLMGWNVSETVFDTSTWPVTLLVAGTVLSERVFPSSTR